MDMEDGALGVAKRSSSRSFWLALACWLASAIVSGAVLARWPAFRLGPKPFDFRTLMAPISDAFGEGEATVYRDDLDLEAQDGSSGKLVGEFSGGFLWLWVLVQALLLWSALALPQQLGKAESLFSAVRGTWSSGSALFAEWKSLVVGTLAVAAPIVAAAVVVGTPVFHAVYDHRTVLLPNPAELRPWWLGEVREHLVGPQFHPSNLHEELTEDGDGFESWRAPEPDFFPLLFARITLDWLLLFPLSLFPLAWASSRVLTFALYSAPGLATSPFPRASWVVVWLYRVPLALTSGSHRDLLSWLLVDATCLAFVATLCQFDFVDRVKYGIQITRVHLLVGASVGARVSWLLLDRFQSLSIIGGCVLLTALIVFYPRVRNSSFVRSLPRTWYSWALFVAIIVPLLGPTVHIEVARWVRVILQSPLPYKSSDHGIPQIPAEVLETLELQTIAPFVSFSPSKDVVTFEHCPYGRMVQLGKYAGEKGAWLMPVDSVEANLVRTFCYVPFLGWKNFGFSRFEPRRAVLRARPFEAEGWPMSMRSCPEAQAAIDKYRDHDLQFSSVPKDMYYLMEGCPIGGEAEMIAFQQAERKTWCVSEAVTEAERQQAQKTYERRSTQPHTSYSDRKPNVLVLHLDNLGSAHMFTALSKIVQLLAHINNTGSPGTFQRPSVASQRTHEVFHFPYYVTVDRKSHSNQIPLYTGHSWTRFPGLGNASHPGWLWNEFGRNGYRTAWIEGVCGHFVEKIMFGWRHGRDPGPQHLITGVSCHPDHKMFKAATTWRGLGRLQHEYYYDYAEMFLNVSGKPGFYPRSDPRFALISNNEPHEFTGNVIRVAEENTLKFLLNVLSSDPYLMVFIYADHGPHYGNLPEELRGAYVHDLPPLFIVAPTQWLDQDKSMRESLRVNQNRSVTAYDINKTYRSVANWPNRVPPESDPNSGFSLLDGLLPQRTCSEAKAYRYCRRSWDASQEQQCPTLHDGLRWGRPHCLGALVAWSDVQVATHDIYPKDKY